MTKRNLKIAITPEQPLGEVVGELERLGYKPSILYKKNNNYIHTLADGCFIATIMDVDCCRKLTTLTELKEME